ncbi:winged helix-turn-helix domain-containing protein [Salmonella enterica]
MKIDVLIGEKIYFLNFIFNRKLRTLQQAEKSIQLRKKEADVLALLCDKFPDPVSQEDFLSEVWGGSYVTSQSIAQVIRSLRLNLGDKKKNIILTIPKLGYKLAVEPSSDKATLAEYKQSKNNELCNNQQKENSLTEVPATDKNAADKEPRTLISFIHNKRRVLTTKKVIFSVAVLILSSIIFFVNDIESSLEHNHLNSAMTRKLADMGNKFEELQNQLTVKVNDINQFPIFVHTDSHNNKNFSSSTAEKNSNVGSNSGE